MSCHRTRTSVRKIRVDVLGKTRKVRPSIGGSARRNPAVSAARTLAARVPAVVPRIGPAAGTPLQEIRTDEEYRARKDDRHGSGQADQYGICVR
eukprot:2334679-Prymnesium_polylepis.1